MKKLLLLLLIMLVVSPVYADNDGKQATSDNNDDENDFGKGFGSFALALMYIGSVYVVARRLMVFIKGRLDKDTYDMVFSYYREARPYLYAIHAWTNIAATIAASIHGILLWDNGIAEYTGLVATVGMALASVTGAIIWWRFKPVWQNRDARAFTRMLHRQWAFSIIIVLGLIVHLATAD